MGDTPKRDNGGRGWLRGVASGKRLQRWSALVSLALAVALTVQLGVRALPMSALPAKDSGEREQPAWITLDGRNVLEIRVAAGAQTPQIAAQRGSRTLEALARNTNVEPDQLVVRDDPPYVMVGLLHETGRFQPLLAVDERAAKAFGLTREALAQIYRDQLRGAIKQFRATHSLDAWLWGVALALAVLLLYVLWWRVQGSLNRRLQRWLDRRFGQVSLRLGGSQVLDPEQLRGGLQVLRRLAHGSLLLLASYLLIPLLLGFFPPTQAMAEGLRSHILRILGRLLNNGTNAIPNLLAMALILYLTRLAMQGCRAWFAAIDRGRLVFPGFYREWALPTGRLVSGAILLAGLVTAYPYIPGSGSRAFQGAGLFVGLLAALGSSAVATNVISGLMLIYTRAFQEGDRIEINGVLGVVQDRDLLVTRIITPRHEVVSLPNASVIASPILNYSFSLREGAQPVAVATTITIGYDVPWRQVHSLLLAAARSVAGIATEPAAYVLQTSLNDFHISYELNVSVAHVLCYRETLSELLGAIQDQFAAADVEILSPAYHAIRNGNPRTVPAWPPRSET
ncbi:MAG: mechanosensitive ion channel domain-containing protein [Cyanobacteriota bacterium]|nr:mechanosensitive ion channel domain-containing protein [Cyanobacteriota bacterium]